MTQKSIIIIDAGVSGLCAGIYEQMNGYQTRIFEKHKTSGLPVGVSTAREVIWKQCRKDKMKFITGAQSA